MNPVIALLQLAAILYLIILWARVVSHYVRVDSDHPLAQFLVWATEPVLEPIRQILPQGTNLDFSPLVAMLVIYLLLTALSSIVG